MGDKQSKPTTSEPETTPRSPLTDKPWTQQKYFAEPFPKNYEDLKRDLVTEQKNKTDMKNILLLGQIQAGKSSFLNSTATAVEGRPAYASLSGSAEKSFTTTYIQYSSEDLHINVHDCMGIEPSDADGFNPNSIMHLVNGNVPKDFKFNGSNPITETDSDYISNPKDKDKIHCVVYVIDATSLIERSPPRAMAQKIRDLQDRLKATGIPRMVILTKVDLVCEEVCRDIGNIYKSVIVKEIVMKAKELLRVEDASIHPLQNHGGHAQPDHRISILVLNALKMACNYAEDYIRMKRATGHEKYGETTKEAADRVSEIINDLEMTIDLANADLIDTEEGEVFEDHRSSILKTTRALYEDVRPIAGVAPSPEHQASAARKATQTMSQLADVVKRGARSLNTDETDKKLELLNAVSDIASSVSEIISSTKNPYDPAIPRLKELIKVLATRIATLTKTVKSVKVEVATTQAPDFEVARMPPTYVAGFTHQSSELGEGSFTHVQGFGERRNLNVSPLSFNASRGAPPAFATSRQVPSFATTGSSDWAGPDDPTVVAEKELLATAWSIEEAASKLPQLKPRQKAMEAGMPLSFDDHILEAARSITTVTASLIKAATAAQRELVAQSKMRDTSHRTDRDDDGQWSQGLISAARMVAVATNMMCEAANMMVQGSPCNEKLIAAAKEVAASTTALLMACRVKTDAHSLVMKNLQDAGNKVKEATEGLVRFAQQALHSQHGSADKGDRQDVLVHQSNVGAIAQRMAAQEEMLKREKELEESRLRLAQVNKQSYRRSKQSDD